MAVFSSSWWQGVKLFIYLSIHFLQCNNVYRNVNIEAHFEYYTTYIVVSIV